MIVVGINLISFKSDNISGIGQFAKRFFIEMSDFDLSGFHFIVYKQKSINLDLFSFPRTASYEVVNVPDIGGGAKLALFEQTLFYCWLKKCDVMWSPNYSSPWFGKRKKVVSILDIYPLINKKSYGAWKRFWSKILFRINAIAATDIVTISECSRNDLIQILGVPPQKIHLLYCFIPSSEVASIIDATGNDFITISGEKVLLKRPYFLSVSQIKPIKNYEGLIKAFAKFKEKHSDFSLYVVGSKGWDYEEVFNLVARLNLSGSVIFTGYISLEDIHSLYKNCYATVLPSFYEGFGYTPLEGFYRNKIAIASNVSSIPEVVGNAGIYINPYEIDSIVAGLEKSTEDITEYEHNIKNQLSKFDSKAITSCFLDLLRNN